MNDWLKNVAINLHATGPAAAVCVWFLSLMSVAIWAPDKASFAVIVLGIGGITVLLALTQNPGHSR